MGTKTLHITNGDSTTQRLIDMKLVEGEFLVWREMLCEGPTEIQVESKKSILKRKAFLKKYYRISNADYEKKFVSQIKKLNRLKSYDQIILWFEYDLFCHINMCAGISLLLRKEIKNIPIYLICSGKVKRKQNLMGLSELNDLQLKNLYTNKIALDIDDLEFASHIWTLYCESNPNKILPFTTKQSVFEYLPMCLKAHLQRFPNMKTGLNALEHTILDIVHAHKIKNIKHLMDYILKNQGYYGYGDVQMKRVIAKLFQFLNQTENSLKLSERGELALQHKKNFYNTTAHEWYYGGVHKYNYLYNNETHKLLKL